MSQTARHNGAMVKSIRTGKPTMLPRRVADRLAWLDSRIEHDGTWSGGKPLLRILADKAPDDAERRALQARLADLKDGLVGCSADEVAAVVGVLLSGYTPKRGNFDDARSVMLAFAAALKGQPTWALTEACAAWNKAGRSAPSPAELRAECVKLTTYADDEARLIRRVLEAEPYTLQTEAQRRAIGQKMAALAEGFKQRQAASTGFTEAAWAVEFRALIQSGRDDEAAALAKEHQGQVAMTPQLREALARSV